MDWKADPENAQAIRYMQLALAQMSIDARACDQASLRTLIGQWEREGRPCASYERGRIYPADPPGPRQVRGRCSCAFDPS